MQRSSVSLLVLGLLTACSSADPPQSEEMRVQKVDHTPERQRVPLTGGGKLTAGAWRMSTGAMPPELLFDTPSGTLFALSCHTGRGLVAERRRLIPTGPINMMRISVGARARSFAVNPVSGAYPALRAILPADVDVTSALRTKAAIIGVDVGDGPALRLPGSELVAQMAVKCASL